MREAKVRKALEGKHLQRQKLRRKYEKTVIRISFRTQKIVVQAYFSPQERGYQLFQCIRELLDPGTGDFILRIPPTREIRPDLDTGKTLEELKLVPAATLNFIALKKSSGASALRHDILTKKKPLEATVIPKAINEAEIQKALDEIVGPAQKLRKKKETKRRKAEDLLKSFGFGKS